MHHNIEPMMIFCFTRKSRLTTVDDNYVYDGESLSRMSVTVRLLIPIYESRSCKVPLMLYIYHDPKTTIRLKRKQDDNLDAVDYREFFSYMEAGTVMIDDFIDSMNESILAGALRTIDIT